MKLTFEEQLWATLQGLHDLDAPHHAWDHPAQRRPCRPSFLRSALPASRSSSSACTRRARASPRRFAWPTLSSTRTGSSSGSAKTGSSHGFSRSSGAARRAAGRRQPDARQLRQPIGSGAVLRPRCRALDGRARFTHAPTMTRHRIEPQTGTAFELAMGQLLRVIDPLGEQVADLIAFGLRRSCRVAVVRAHDRLRRHDLLHRRARAVFQPQPRDVHDRRRYGGPARLPLHPVQPARRSRLSTNTRARIRAASTTSARAWPPSGSRRTRFRRRSTSS